MAIEERDYYPSGIKSLNGIEGKWLRIQGTVYASPGATATYHIPANSRRKFLHISVSQAAQSGTPVYTGRFGVSLKNEATNNYVFMWFNPGTCLLINEFTIPWCGGVDVLTDDSGNTGHICIIEGTVE